MGSLFLMLIFIEFWSIDSSSVSLIKIHRFLMRVRKINLCMKNDLDQGLALNPSFFQPSFQNWKVVYSHVRTNKIR